MRQKLANIWSHTLACIYQYIVQGQHAKRILHLFSYLKANIYNGSCLCNFNLSDLGTGMIHFNTTVLPSRPSLSTEKG